MTMLLRFTNQERSGSWSSSLLRRQIVTRKSWFYVMAFALLFPVVAWCQAAGQPDPSPAALEPVTYSGYLIHQSFEAGYRVSDSTGSESMFDTLVNTHEGPRLFEQTFSMRSENHQGVLFDDFWLHSMGWGGDPNNYLRFRVGKNRWYDFRASFRRDQNFSDFNLLANPLNPSSSPTSPVSIPRQPLTSVWLTGAAAVGGGSTLTDRPVDFSPHGFETRRRMSDFDLTLLPRSIVTFRLGFSHSNMTGPSWTSIHEGTEGLLYQPWNTTLNTYRVGVDVKAAPRTILSYDQVLNYYRGDTGQSLQWPATADTLINSSGDPIPVNLGLPFNTSASQPCATPFLSDGTVNPACNAYFAYTRTNRSRTAFPTEQGSFRSNYLRKADVTASLSYTAGDLTMPAYSESFDGLTTRNRTRNSSETADVVAHRASVTADAGIVLHVTDRFRVVDTFRFFNFRLPGTRDYITGVLFGATLLSAPNVFSSATCPPPFTAATCPQHNSSSGADLTVGHAVNFLKQDTKNNTVELQYDFSRKVSARLGYRSQHRTIFESSSDAQQLTFYPTLPNRGACAGLPLDSNGVCSTTAAASDSTGYEIQGQSLLAGLSVRPSRELRVNFDTEQFYADHSFTRLTFTRESRYRLGGTYMPRPWAVIGASLNTVNNRNDDAAVDYRGHNYNGGFNLSLNPRERFGLDLAYNYASYLQNSTICFNDTPPAGVTLPVVTNAGDCSAYESSNPLLTDGYYESSTHFGMGAVMFKPVPRVTTRVGYSVTSVGGRIPQFNILQPLGSLAYNYHQPVADLDINLVRNITWHAGWNYCQYGEKDFSGPTLPRYFHANEVTLSLKYAF
jgi:opacity protein-like surface antigen